MQTSSVMTSFGVQLKNGKILNKKISLEILKQCFWHHICASQKEQNDTLSFIAIATLSAPVSLCHKKNQMSPFAAFQVRQRVLLGTNIVPILS